MKPIERLREYIKIAYPQAVVTLTPPLSEDGVWSIDLAHGERNLVIEWSLSTGFGVSSLNDESYGERPDEAFKSLEDVQRRIAELLIGNERTTPPIGVLLSRLREIRGYTQEQLASKLGVRQATVSGMERRGDVQFSTLRRVIKALSGSIEIFAAFSDTRYRLDIDSIDCSVDAQVLVMSREHANFPTYRNLDRPEFDYNVQFQALYACGKLSQAKQVGDEISSRGMVLEMAD